MDFFKSFARPLVAVAIIALAACGGAAANPAASPAADVGSGNLTGAGSTFTEPFYTRAFYAYSTLHERVTVNYQPVGSGAGIQQFTNRTVDFGASDVPMKDSEIAAAGGADSLVQLPTTLGVVAIAYNLPGIDRLQLDSAALAGIYLGYIKRWNDPALTALNPTVNLPGKDITVVHRSDGSGTTFAFTDYLSKVSDEWRSKVGNGKSVQWPAGIGASGNQAVAQGVIQNDGGIGYVELAYVVQAKMQMAYLKNQAGRFLQASVAGASAAAAQKSGLSPANFSITNQPGDASYPIASFTWAILRKDQADPGKGKAIVYLFKWLATSGQQYGKDLQYAPLPTDAQTLAVDTLKQITSGGDALLS
jgi:phosphate transport system substrate-binding protein